MKTSKDTADELVSLLIHCQKLQSEKDGLPRPEPGTYSRSRDAFAERINEACLHARMLEELLPMYSQLTSLGMELELQNKILLTVGQSYSQAALAYIMVKYLSVEKAQ